MPPKQLLCNLDLIKTQKIWWAVITFTKRIPATEYRKEKNKLSKAS